MKNFAKYLIIACCIATSFFWMSCDKIDDPYTTTIVNVDGNRKVLLEDYTAIRCINCPAAAALAHQINDTYNNKVIIMSIHGGSLAVPMPNDSLFNFDLRSSEGTEYYNYYHIESQPSGIIDKVKNPDNNSYVWASTNWQSEISSRLLKESPINFLSLESNIVEGKVNARINFKTLSSFSQDQEYRLLLYLVQDSVITGQKNSNPAYGSVPNITNYVHHNVLRGTVNGTWGTVVDLPDNGQSSMLFTNYPIPNYDAEARYNIIAIIYNEDEVLQAEEYSIQ